MHSVLRSAIILSVFLFVGSIKANAQLNSLTVSVNPSTVSFSLTSGGIASGSGPVVITTSWSFVALRSAINVYGSFASVSAALSDGAGHNIASSSVLGQVPTGLPLTFTAFAQTGPFGAGGGSLRLLSQSITVLTLTGSRNDTLNFRVDLSSTPQLPAGVYTGTIVVQAQAL